MIDEAKDNLQGKYLADCREERLFVSRQVGNLSIEDSLWDYTFGPEKMNLDPSECLIMLTEPPMNPLKNRETMLEVMFEHYGFHGAYLAIQAVLTLYAQGLLTGENIEKE